MDRRFFLSATVIASAAIATPVIALPCSAFERAHAAWVQARLAFDVPLDDDASGIAIVKVDQTFEAMLRTPARNSGDIAAKLDAMLIEYEGSDWDEDRVRIIAADARRLAIA